MKPPSDRSGTSGDGPKKPPSDDGEDEWDPQPAELREGETTDVSSHASRNVDLITSGHRDQLPDKGDIVESHGQEYRAASETTVDGKPAMLMTTKFGDQKLYRVRFDRGLTDPPVVEYHELDEGRSRGSSEWARTWQRKYRGGMWPGYEGGEGDE